MSIVSKLRLLTTLLLLVPLLAMGLSAAIALPGNAVAQTPTNFQGYVSVSPGTIIEGTPVRVLEDSTVLGETTTGIFGADNFYWVNVEVVPGTTVTFEVEWDCDGGAQWIPALETAIAVPYVPVETDLSITCGPTPPTVTTVALGVTDIGHNSATLRGSLVRNGYSPVDVYFELDTMTKTVGPRSTDGAFSYVAGGLTPDTPYNYKACGDYDGETTCGSPMSFRTEVGPEWPITKDLVTDWNVISTPVWLDSDSDTIGDIISGGYDLAYRWTGTSFVNLASSYVWKPLEAFYIKVTSTATATFNPLDEMKAPNKRVLTGNRWQLVGSSPDDGTSAQSMDIVLANLKDNYSNVILPALNLNGSGDTCAVGTLDPCTGLTLPAFGGAWVFVGSGTTKTIVGFYGFTPVVP